MVSCASDSPSTESELISGLIDGHFPSNTADLYIYSGNTVSVKADEYHDSKDK